jgi:hypothetical protein
MRFIRKRGRCMGEATSIQTIVAEAARIWGDAAIRLHDEPEVDLTAHPEIDADGDESDA